MSLGHIAQQTIKLGEVLVVCIFGTCRRRLDTCQGLHDPRNRHFNDVTAMLARCREHTLLPARDIYKVCSLWPEFHHYSHHLNPQLYNSTTLHYSLQYSLLILYT
jgi:hypothetical protein